MGEAFFKYLKWWVSISAFIICAYFLQLYADSNKFQYIGGVLGGLGVVFWLSKVTYEAPKNIFLAGTAVLIIAGLLTRFIAQDFLTPYVGDGFYFIWWLCTSALGLPVMMYYFAKEG